MKFAPIDWAILLAFFLISILLGLYSARKAGRDTTEYFLSGRSMPWWLLGVSMVATTFSCDTPNLVADLVRQHGVAGNWLWWAFLLTGMLTVFVYARLWRRSEVLTDIEFYELRYGGRMAAMLRAFRAVYLGLFFNVIVIALVSLAMIKIGGIMLGWSAVKTLVITSIVTLIYSASGGLRGILRTDFFQFFVSIAGAIVAAWYVLGLPEVGGLQAMMVHPDVIPKLSMFPDFSNSEAVIMLLILPLAVQWWSVWYPGSEPGGGGYIAQRMLSARSEREATKAVLLFNIAHYALRPWPWILVALASLIVFPDLASLSAAFPHVDPQFVRHDLAYPAMLSYLPAGLMGIVITSLVAAYMSTVSTQLNWGASYLVNDFYRRFLQPDASEAQLVRAGRICTVLLMLLAGFLSLALSNSLQGFQILLQIGAGTGLIFILRWFWWRINAWTEITGMVVSFLVAIYFQFCHTTLGLAPIRIEYQMVIGVVITTVAWLTVTLLTRPERREVLVGFYRLVRPAGVGWRPVSEWSREDPDAPPAAVDGWNFPQALLCMLVATFATYAALFAIGFTLYLDFGAALIFGILSVAGFVVTSRIWRAIVR